MSTSTRRNTRRKKGLPNWRIVRYADDFVILVHGSQGDVLALREEIAGVLAPMGLRLSESKTQVVHMSEGFDFLGFHIRWKRKPGTNKWYVYTFIAKRPLRAVKAKIRALTRRSSPADLRDTLIRINQILRAWIVAWQMRLHRWRWADIRRWLADHTGRWKPISADGITLYNPGKVGITRYRYRGAAIPLPWT